MPLTYRRNNILDNSDTYLQAATSRSITLYYQGGIVDGAQSDVASIDVFAGHGFSVDDYFFVNTATTTIYKVTSIASTSIGVTPNITVLDKDSLVNIEGDSLTSSTPDWDGSTVSIYDVPDTSGSAITDSTVTTNTDGQYDYYYNQDLVYWEVVRDSSNNVEEIVKGVGQINTLGIYTSTTKPTASASLYGKSIIVKDASQGAEAQICLLKYDGTTYYWHSYAVATPF